MSQTFAGTKPLLKTTARFDGKYFAPWVMIAVLLSVSSVVAYPLIFPDLADRQALATMVGSNPALSIIFGPAFDLTTNEGFNTWRSLALGGFLTALGATLALTRATRSQEDSGQAELLASGVLGRNARLGVGVVIALGGSLVAGLVSGLLTAVCGGGWESSMLLCLTFTGSGFLGAALASVTGQIGSDSRTANSLAISIFSILFVLRGFSYALDAPMWTVWINPLGWLTETRPGSGDHWLPLVFVVALTGCALVVAFFLQTRRDLGQGVVTPRPGPATGRVHSPVALAIRINRPTIISWIIAFLALGLIFGSFTNSITDVLTKDSNVAAILASGATTPEELSGAFIVTVISLMGIIAAIAGIQTMQRMRAEEIAGRTEVVLAGGVSRSHYLGAQAFVAFVGPAFYILIATAAVGLFASQAGIGTDFSTTMLQGLATIPATWLIVAIAVLFIGVRPEGLVAAWAALLASFLITMLGPMLKLNSFFLGISPFWHVPNVTAKAPDYSGIIWLSAIVVTLVGIGFAAYRHRDISGN